MNDDTEATPRSLLRFHKALAPLPCDARAAQAAGASRFCMGAAWRSPTDRDVDKMVLLVRALGLETCATLGLPVTSQRAA